MTNLDFIYNRKNRIVLDFLNKCFRPNESTRPSADDLLTHKMLEWFKGYIYEYCY